MKYEDRAYTPAQGIMLGVALASVAWVAIILSWWWLS